MANFFNSSVGKKIIMSLSGLFLIIFLLLHLTLNLLAVFDSTGKSYIAASEFMEHNAIIFIMQFVLAGGFLIHILYGSWLTYQNRKFRPVAYAIPNKTDVSWSSQNMWVTGALVLGFLVLHLYNFLYKIKFTDLIESGQMNEYDLIKSIFSVDNWPFSVLYLVWFIILALHLNHALQSAFQTIGLNNQKWIKRLKWLSSIYALIIGVGFSIITVYFFIQSLNN
ncbi:MAG: succinate dehydrogenase cytochrome b subunit [Bacteroidales bacterium]